MARLFSRLPAEHRRRLRPDERVLAWGKTPAGAPVIASNWGLWLPERGVLDWHRIHKASWDPKTLTVIGSHDLRPDVVADDPAIAVKLDEPGKLPKVVRERVLHTVVHTLYHELGDGRGFRVVARRVPGRDGPHWALRFDEPDDACDRGRLEQARSLLMADRERLAVVPG